MDDILALYAAAKAKSGGSVTPEQVQEAVSEWLEENVDPETGYVIDNSLTIAGAAADAKAVGDEVDDLKSAIENLETIIPRSVKRAMDTLFSKAAYADADAASSYAIFHTWATAVASITAVFDQGSATIYETDSLDTLKQYLTVTANYSDGTSEVITDYTLSGALIEGTSTITVSYVGKTDTFDVTVTGWTLKWSYLDGGLPNVVAPNDWDNSRTGPVSYVSFVNGEGIKWTGINGGETYTPKNYRTTSEGTMEIVVNFPEESENLNVRATLNTASDTLIGFIFSQGIKVNGSGSDYSFIPNTSVVLGTDNTLRVVRENNIGKVYLNGVMVYSGELRSLSGTNNVLISPASNLTGYKTVYVRAIRFKHLQ